MSEIIKELTNDNRQILSLIKYNSIFGGLPPFGDFPPTYMVTLRFEWSHKSKINIYKTERRAIEKFNSLKRIYGFVDNTQKNSIPYRED